ncbi:MAG: ABC transporter substrate-binding protein [Bacteroidetes bacterium]|nr:ABC transporter substrate-binding protein [Bacteroidota bacterium]
MKKKYYTYYYLRTLGWRLIALLFLLPLGLGQVFSQQSTPPLIKKSDKIETIEGKKFYIHLVEKGQTLYSIAKAYGTTVDIILSNNQDISAGLKSGKKIKIPFSENTEAIKKEIEKQVSAKSQTLPPKKEIVSNALSKEKDTAYKKETVALDLKNTMNISLPVQKKDSTGVIVKYSMKNEADLHVALFLPLSLNSIDEINTDKIAMGDEKISEDVKAGIEFYEGAKMAFDSLRREGFKGYLHVYDYNLDSAGFEKLLKNSELKEMDLIIGPLHGKKFEAVEKFSKEHNISIIAPFLTNNNILLGNPNASKVTPSYVTQADALAQYVSENFSGQNIILFNSANPKDKPYLNTFKRVANPILQKSNADTVKEITFTTLQDFTRKTKPNIVVIPSSNQSFVTEAVNKLFLDKQENQDSIIVFGMNNFQDIESLDFGYLNALHVYVASCSFVDYNNAQTQKFILKYRKEFKGEPTSHVFSGFDIALYYLSALRKYGHYLNKKLPELKQKGIQTEFNFYQADSENGYENKGVGIMKFENYSYTRVK